MLIKISENGTWYQRYTENINTKILFVKGYLIPHTLPKMLFLRKRIIFFWYCMPYSAPFEGEQLLFLLQQ
jgi:hypothetical protein